MLKEIPVTLYNEMGEIVATTETNNKGHYKFEGLDAGEYKVVFDYSKLPTTKTDLGLDVENQSRIDSNYAITDITLPTDEVIHSNDKKDFNQPNLDAGFVEFKRSLEGTAWLDTDRNGKREDGEDLLKDIPVTLYDETGKEVATTITDGKGHYSFKDLDAGNYKVVFDYSKITTIQSADLNAEDRSKVDADKVISNINLPTDAQMKADGTSVFNQSNLDAGFIEYKRSLEGTAWLDADKNGTREDGEKLLKDIPVTLYKDNKEVAKTTTDGKGHYKFEGLEAGEYKVVFDYSKLPTTKTDLGLDVENQSRIDNDYAITDITLPTDELIHISDKKDYNQPNLDAGFVEFKRSLEGTAWLDTNKDGIRDVNEPTLGEMTIVIFDEKGNNVGQTKTDANGHYVFNDLPAGKYDVYFVTDRELTIQSTDMSLENVSKLGKDYYIHSIELPTDEDLKSQNLSEFTVSYLDGGFIQNMPVETHLMFYKVDKDSNLLKGATFKLVLVEGQQETEIKTESNGPKFDFMNLKDGLYRIYETKAPDGYKELSKPIEIKISDGKVYYDGQMKESFNVINEKNTTKESGNVQTSDNTNIYGYVTVSCISLLGIIIFMTKREKSKQR